MAGTYACATLFFHTSPEELVERYEENAEPANGYLIRLNGEYMLVDATATETADWARQVQLATAMSENEAVALSILLVGEQWALSLAYDGQQGPTAIYVPKDTKLLEQVPRHLLAIEKALEDLFPGDIDTDVVDAIFGAMLDGATPVEEALTEILEMLGCPPSWLRWSWYETIPQQLFTDPDLLKQVTPLGEAKQFWEE